MCNRSTIGSLLMLSWPVILIAVVFTVLIQWSNWRTHYSDGSKAIWYLNIDNDWTMLPESHSRIPYGHVYNDLGIPMD